MKKIILLISGLIFFTNCNNETVKYEKVSLPFEKPNNFPELKYNLESNPLTDKGFELGKKLFYDGRLSSDGAVACAFCHQQKFAFTHHGHQFSHGVEDRKGTRNSQPIQNMVFQSQFAWDGAAFHLDLFPIIPITNENEMGETVTNVLEKLQQDPYYQDLYTLAFEDGKINTENTFKALSQFMIMMVSANSKYDKYIRNEPGGDFTENEKEGLRLFEKKCASCHKTALFTDDSFKNNGLPINPEINDVGRMRVTLLPEDKYKFKVPSLRNIALTAPYMHDGRFGSLKSVLNFYANGMQETENLAPILKHDNGSLGIPMSSEEQQNIILFLETLTDNEFINDERFKEK
ncbi:cytochrome-c peroxidase [Tenacibaculum maritimum]|uniref:cytochrome-c peroxidase n=1 Tax=Tenacibaculum maritimum TaxID=107401 RepID=UPI0012E48C01|nr:cytochrome c peroxidase [Tenacibaculum maritimum]MCD9582810.1 cytochrome-c peroxidase [Tenacibaculum maritimum]MCD9636966.1 cytochrome-c peroxidase [Tenacibaculum maritimum]CAA0151322.1 Cytochrome-c peroxidase [Tenacibaculum maritimum]CAA0226938.1 Cytochrome-c peroxidase [Tenacibaculum maritimum]